MSARGNQRTQITPVAIGRAKPKENHEPCMSNPAFRDGPYEWRALIRAHVWKARADSFLEATGR
jgi:hypothetical protein